MQDICRIHYVAELYGENVLLSHGDAYCTDDVQYQTLRKMTRDPALAGNDAKKTTPGTARIRRHRFVPPVPQLMVAYIKEDITDVNQRAIEQAMLAQGERRYDVAWAYTSARDPQIHRSTESRHPVSFLATGMSREVLCAGIRTGRR